MAVTSPGGPVRRLAGLLHRRPVIRLAALLTAPLLWLVVAYLGSLGALFLTAFWTTNEFTGDVVEEELLVFEPGVVRPDRDPHRALPQGCCC